MEDAERFAAHVMRDSEVALDLAYSSEPIVALAIEAGFADQPHRTRAFRAFTGLTPARYRRLRRN